MGEESHESLHGVRRVDVSALSSVVTCGDVSGDFHEYLRGDRHEYRQV